LSPAIPALPFFPGRDVCRDHELADRLHDDTQQLVVQFPAAVSAIVEAVIRGPRRHDHRIRMPESVFDRQHSESCHLGMLRDDMFEPLVGEPYVSASIVADEACHDGSSIVTANA
jgi:hypothetical protein